MLLPWTQSQVSFLKDLVTLRNPRSEFSFLNYLRSVGRLDDFVNMGSFTPYRVEVSGYLRWVSESLRKVRLELGCESTSIEPVRNSAGTLTGWLTTARRRQHHLQPVPGHRRRARRLRPAENWRACPRTG